VAKYITGRHIRELDDGTYFHFPTSEVLEEAGFFLLEKQTVMESVRMRLIFQHCVKLDAFS
jgi:hypothetical protein